MKDLARRRRGFWKMMKRLGNEVKMSTTMKSLLVGMKMVILKRELVKTTTNCQRATAQLLWRWTGL